MRSLPIVKFLPWLLSGLLPGMLAVVLAIDAGVAQETGFVAEIEDLPLMPGLSEVEGAGVVFDKPSGRIVEAYARGAVTAEAVMAFYRNTLPQLGWAQGQGTTFKREGERLAVEFLKGEGPLTLRFVLRPD